VVPILSARSIYAKPLPFDTTLDRLTEFFSALGKVGAVRMRRHLESKDFKGSVFVEFDSPATANMVSVAHTWRDRE
jgi:lupus La protein